jgi:hypothetical protein
MARCLRWLTFALVMGGCGAGPAPQHLRLADAHTQGSRIDWTRPLVLEINPGDRLPVRIAFSDQLFELNPAAPKLELVAKRRGFIRIDAGRITSSLNGDDFEKSPLAPGQFRFGLAITRQGSSIEVAVTTPRRAEGTKP